MAPLQYISTSALSLTLSGNTGVAPFLTLFLIGVIEKSDPTLLYMDGWVEKIIASWPGIVIFGVLTVLEFVGKCVPVVDEMIDSAVAFVVPIFSLMASLASHGLFTAPESASTEAREPHPVYYDFDYDGRRLEEGGSSGGGGPLLTFLQVMLSIVGVFLALLVHVCLMVVRLLGEGCCTGCITVFEDVWVVSSVTVCIFIVPIAIGAALLLLVAAGFGFRSWYRKRQEKKAEAAAAEGTLAGVASTGGDATTTGGSEDKSKSKDEEEGKRSAKAGDGLGAAGSGLDEPLLP